MCQFKKTENNSHTMVKQWSNNGQTIVIYSHILL